MLKAIRLALKYRHMLEPAIEFINIVQNSVKDGHLTKKERGEVMSKMWDLIKRVQKLQ